MPGSVSILCNKQDEFAGLKAISKSLKDYKKSQATYGFEYLGGWFDKQRKTGDYVKELADLPTKEELVAKLLYMLKYPLQSLASTLDQVAKKAS
jgi:large subunit ribosomal protein L10